ncbi:putative Mrr-cat superfamily restriction endonuclease [Paenibacillus castaneae]|uniref:hypothetical protein n=1 Tax=Paenibacillus castaneae TaxID=474957 RepID=UPI00141AA6AF|nr:hypothetical protein [Paenibacillus castaneae]NIK80533.1 putative Mrr-cat superfamily restriction endonuclease [Paenibacillus castaneae]
MNVYLLRPIPHGSNQLSFFLKHNRIAIGYPLQTDLRLISYSDIRQRLKAKGWEKGSGNVFRMLETFGVGDLVLVPDDNQRDVYFCQVKSDYDYDPKLDEDKAGSGFPHYRHVEWFFNKTPINRSQLPDPLLKSLQFPGTSADLTKHLDLILPILGLSKDETISDEDVLQADRLQRLKSEALDLIEKILNGEDRTEALKAAQIILSLKD